MKQVIRLTAKKLVQTYVIHGCVNDNVVSMLARNGYKTPLPADIVNAIEELKSLHRKRFELIKSIERVDRALERNTGWIPSHVSECDDEYQERLELNWEMRDLKDDLKELLAKIDQLKAIAKL